MKFTTNSELQTYKFCKRKWWLAHYRRLQMKRGEAKRPRDVGDIVHKSLDAYYGGNFDQAAAWVRWNEIVAPMLEKFPDQEKDVRWITDWSRVMIEGYFEWLEETGADSHLRIIAPEVDVGAPIGDTGYVLLGKIDTRVWNEQIEQRQFLETKTVANFSDKERTANLDEQIMEYHLLELLSDLENAGTAGGTLNMIRRTKRTKQAKPPFFKRVDVWHNRDELREFYNRVFGEILDLERTRQRLDAGESHQIVVYPTVSKACTYMCDFFAVCGMLNDPNSNAEGLIAAKYQEHDPVARYGTIIQDMQEA